MKNWINSNGLSVGIITLFILIATGFYSAEENYLFWTTGTKEKAFLNTTWGMSKKEVKRSNRTTQSWPTELKGMGEVLWNVKIRRDHISTPFFPRIEVAPKSRTNIVIFKVCSLAFSYAAIAAASSPQ